MLGQPRREIKLQLFDNALGDRLRLEGIGASCAAADRANSQSCRPVGGEAGFSSRVEGEAKEIWMSRTCGLEPAPEAIVR